MEELEPMLEMGNADSRNKLDSLRQMPNNPLKNQLIEQIEDLDFEQAIITLIELKKKLMAEG